MTKPFIVGWKVVLEGRYVVSNRGDVSRILASNLWRPIKPGTTRGYKKFTACVVGKRMNVPVHRLVAEAFLGPRPTGMQINHINGRKDDNRVENLEYVTSGDNTRHAQKMGLRQVGNKRLSEAEVAEIRRLYVKGRPGIGPNGNADELAARFGVNRSHICDLARRRFQK